MNRQSGSRPFAFNHLVLVLILAIFHSPVVLEARNLKLQVHHDKTLYLPCDMEKQANEVFVWTKDGKMLNFDNISDDRMKLFNNGTLRIGHTVLEDVGDYACRKRSPGGGLLPLSFIVHLRGKPIIGEFEAGKSTGGKSINVVDGDKLSLTCRVIINDMDVGPPVWYKKTDGPPEGDELGEQLRPQTRFRHTRMDNIFDYSYGEDIFHYGDSAAMPMPVPAALVADQPMMVDERTYIKNDLSNGTSSTLIIEPLVFSDRAYYTCVADNGVISTNRTILIRVKDKLAALWPFLGIVAEVIVLCIVIFVYEKRRTKAELADDSPNPASQSDSQGRRSGGTSPDVRHRQNR